jgi:CHAT domain-containing protein/tetratricopeptide (TPR) repeat protein
MLRVPALRFGRRLGLALLACSLAANALAQGTADPQKLLAEADRLAWLRAWTRAEPLYSQARAAFITAGDKRNALYAEVSRLRGQLPTLPVPEVSDRLAAYLDDPIAVGDERLRLRVLIIKGETDEDLDPVLSQRSWSEALAIAEKLADAGWANRARGELGLVAFLQGDTNTAIVNLGQAIKVAESNGDTSSVVRWLTLFGHGYVELNRPEQALDFYDRALKIAGTIPELQLPLMTYVGKADVLTKLGRASEAEQLLNTALEAARKERALGYQAELTLRLGRVALERKQTDRALEATADATALARAAGANRILVEVALERARLLRSLNRVADADTTLRTGISTARAMGDRLLLPRLLAQLADVRLSRGRLADAATLLEEADDIVEGLITRASSPWVRSRIIAGWDDVLVTRIRLEGERSRGDPARLFAVLERARGRSLLELLNSNSSANGKRPAEWRTGERKIATLQLQLLRTTDRATRQRLLDQIFVAEEQLAPISTQLFAAANRSARTQVSLAQVRAALRPDELLLEYVLAEPSSFTVAVTRTDSRLIKLPGRSVIEAQIQSLVREIQDGQQATNEAKALGTTLVGAVSNIARFTRLIVSADGMTHTVPFEMLVSQSGTLLLETHVVSYVPSASTLVALRGRARRVSPTQMTLAIGASPDVAAGTTASAATIGSVTRGVYDVDAEQLRPLPSAGNEARAVVAAFPGRPSTVLVGSAATEQAVKSQPLASFRFMHFAAHGIVSTKSPARSAIVLRPAAGEDGLFQAREILGLRLNADLVTLSACDTGTGTVHGQEGVASLVRPFIAAGARAVVANLWAADDSFSLSMMSEFYRRLASGADVGESLRQAKLKMRQQFGPVAVPKLWSGILASGDTAIAVAPATTTQR